jgi:hypothetical protein
MTTDKCRIKVEESVVRAALQQVFVQTDEKSAHANWRESTRRSLR